MLLHHFLFCLVSKRVVHRLQRLLKVVPHDRPSYADFLTLRIDLIADEIATSIFYRTAVPWLKFLRPADTVMKLSVIEVTPGVFLKALLMAGVASRDVFNALDHAEFLTNGVVSVSEGSVIAALKVLVCWGDDRASLGPRAAGHVFAVQEVFEVLSGGASRVDSGQLHLGRFRTEGDNLRLVLVIRVIG